MCQYVILREIRLFCLNSVTKATTRKGIAMEVSRAEFKELRELARAMLEVAIDGCEFRHQVHEVTEKYQELCTKIDWL